MFRNEQTSPLAPSGASSDCSQVALKPLAMIMGILLSVNVIPCAAQNSPLLNKTNFIGAGDLPPHLAASLQRMGGRMSSADKSAAILTGTITDAKGSRAAQIIVQAPGQMSFREGQTRAVTFNGNKFQSRSGQLTSDDERISESLLAHLPESVFLQLASGGGLRRIGSHFRTDDGKSRTYTGPYWTMFAFSPSNRQGLARGRALQQEIFIAIDEKTSLMSEVRTVVNAAGRQQNVTQTQFSDWIQLGDHWFPGTITRLENGLQVLRFQTQQATVGPSTAMPGLFEP